MDLRILSNGAINHADIPCNPRQTVRSVGCCNLFARFVARRNKSITAVRHSNNSVCMRRTIVQTTAIAETTQTQTPPTIPVDVVDIVTCASSNVCTVLHCAINATTRCRSSSSSSETASFGHPRCRPHDRSICLCSETLDACHIPHTLCVGVFVFVCLCLHKVPFFMMCTDTRSFVVYLTKGQNNTAHEQTHTHTTQINIGKHLYADNCLRSHTHGPFHAVPHTYICSYHMPPFQL